MTLRTLAHALLAALLLAGCGGTTTPVASPTAAPVTPVPSQPAAPTADTVQTIEVTVAGGSITGGLRTVDVALNAPFRLVVSSDVADEVHLHGYDLKADVAAGATVTLEGTATIPGVVVAELENAALTIVRISTK